MDFPPILISGDQQLIHSKYLLSKIQIRGREVGRDVFLKSRDFEKGREM